MVAGFVIAGPDSQRVLVRGVGPALAGFGVAGVLADPVLKLYQNVAGTTVLREENRTWTAASNASEIVSTTAAVGGFEPLSLFSPTPQTTTQTYRKKAKPKPVQRRHHPHVRTKPRRKQHTLLRPLQPHQRLLQPPVVHAVPPHHRRRPPRPKLQRRLGHRPTHRRMRRQPQVVVRRQVPPKGLPRRLADNPRHAPQPPRVQRLQPPAEHRLQTAWWSGVWVVRGGPPAGGGGGARGCRWWLRRRLLRPTGIPIPHAPGFLFPRRRRRRRTKRTKRRDEIVAREIESPEGTAPTTKKPKIKRPK